MSSPLPVPDETPHFRRNVHSGIVYVADFNNSRIQKFDASGTFPLTWGSLGSVDGAFNTPEGVATDTSGNVYVADTFNDRIQKFTCP